jgi:hypothetical protein
MKQGDTLVIACGAIAKELARICEMNNWDHVKLQCLPPGLHNSPERIPEAVMQKIKKHKDRYANIFVAYADCGTAGALDKALAGLGIERLHGAHCYEFFAGRDFFPEIAQQEAGSFYVTDFLVRHFERLVIQGLGLDRNPKLIDVCFRNYKRLVYIAQTESVKLKAIASSYAERLNLEFIYIHRGDAPLLAQMKLKLEKRSILFGNKTRT